MNFITLRSARETRKKRVRGPTSGRGKARNVQHDVHVVGPVERQVLDSGSHLGHTWRVEVPHRGEKQPARVGRHTQHMNPLARCPGRPIRVVVEVVEEMDPLDLLVGGRMAAACLRELEGCEWCADEMTGK